MGYAATIVEGGGYIFCGQSAVEGSELQTAILIRTDASGDTLWTRNYGTYPKNFGHDVVQAEDGGFAFCGGTSSPDFSYYDAWLVKTNDEGQVISFIPGQDEASELSVFPNPSAGIFSIRIPLATQKVTVTDALGKILVIFVATELKNKEQLRLNLGNESPGIYFVTVQTSARTISLPVILVPAGK